MIEIHRLVFGSVWLLSWCSILRAPYKLPLFGFMYTASRVLVCQSRLSFPINVSPYTASHVLEHHPHIYSPFPTHSFCDPNMCHNATMGLFKLIARILTYTIVDLSTYF